MTKLGDKNYQYEVHIRTQCEQGISATAAETRYLLRELDELRALIHEQKLNAIAQVWADK